jgi:PIN domain nuclease of toxin-antitoxin system
MIIELDFLVALSRKDDKYHNNVLEIIRKHELALSPYALSELDLLVWSGRFTVKDPILFFKLLSETLKYYNIRVLPPSSNHISQAYKLRNIYELTFFDSLHAATSIIEDIPIISYDRKYQKIKEIHYIHPSTI